MFFCCLGPCVYFQFSVLNSLLCCICRVCFRVVQGLLLGETLGKKLWPFCLCVPRFAHFFPNTVHYIPPQLYPINLLLAIKIKLKKIHFTSISFSLNFLLPVIPTLYSSFFTPFSQYHQAESSSNINTSSFKMLHFPYFFMKSTPHVLLLLHHNLFLFFFTKIIFQNGPSAKRLVHQPSSPHLQHHLSPCLQKRILTSHPMIFISLSNLGIWSQFPDTSCPPFCVLPHPTL